MANRLPSDKTPDKITTRSAGSSIAGERITAQARKFTGKPNVIIGGIKKESGHFDGNACCVVERPLELKKNPAQQAKTSTTSSVPANNCIHGHSILGQARTIGRMQLTTGSSKHKIGKYPLHGDCYCVIRRELTGLHSTS